MKYKITFQNTISPYLVSDDVPTKKILFIESDDRCEAISIAMKEVDGDKIWSRVPSLTITFDEVQ